MMYIFRFGDTNTEWYSRLIIYFLYNLIFTRSKILFAQFQSTRLRNNQLALQKNCHFNRIRVLTPVIATNSTKNLEKRYLFFSHE